MDMDTLVTRCRSYRRFDSTAAITEQTLRDLVSLARRTASGANRQPLRYVLSCTAKGNDLVFPTLAWAGYLPEWGGPKEGERPTAYIVVLLDTRVSSAADIDVGIACQTMLLGAVERGLGGCIFGAVKRGELASRLSLPEHLAISVVIALGKPVEKVVLEGLPTDGSIKYYREPDGTHHVPKRPLEDLVVSVLG
jgi:nitroreductase